MDTFGEWLHQQRNLRRLTREEFADRVGCSVAMLRKIENDERRPSTQIARLMANALEIPPAEQETFVRVARGELRADRVSHLTPPTQNSNISPIQSEATPRSNLPVLPTPLIGRTHELNELSRLLRDPQCRLLTLVGPGGIGKTRLAVEVATQLQDGFADGAYFAPLASVDSARFLIPVIADSIGFAFQSMTPADPKMQLFNYLQGKQVLLLGDNIEHLLKEPDIELFVELLTCSPRVKLLVTSREPMNLQSEWVFEVQGLPFTESENIQGTAIELFWQRARRTYAEFDTTPKNLPAIFRICQLLDGHPLAIELAAAWVRTLTCDEIAEEIERGSDFLSVSFRDMPARHRSMRAIFDHSWKLLTEEEQKVLCRLSIFQGGFKREAAEHVAGASLQVLSSLVIRSLLPRSSSGRYNLHDLLRKYALTKLEKSSDELANTRESHCSYYLDFFGDREGDLRNGRQLIAMSEIKAEFDNIRVAWHHAVVHGQVSRLRRLALGYRFFDLCAWYQEAYSLFLWTHKELELKSESDGEEDSETIITREYISANLAYICIKLGKFDEARKLLGKSLPVLRSFGASTELLDALRHMGALEWQSGNPVIAQELFMEMLNIAKKINARWYLGLAHGNVGVAKAALGEYQEAYTQLSIATTIHREDGDPHILGIGLQFLGEVLRYLGKYAEAQGCLNESLGISKVLDDRWLRGSTLNQLGLVFKAKGEHAEAARLFRESLAQFQEIDEFGGLLQALKNLGSIHLSQGAYPEARSAYCELLSIAGHEQILPEALDALIGMAHVLKEEGDLEIALALVLLAEDHPLLRFESKISAEQISTEVKSLLTSQQIEAAHAWKNRAALQDVISEVVQTGQIHIQLNSSTP